MVDPAAEWSRLHHGLDPGANPLLWWWLRGIWWLARPLARLGVSPTALTWVGLVLAVDAAFLARRHPWVAAALVLGSVIADGLDGAVAVLSDRATRFGAVADKVADRVSDVAFAGVLWRCGAPWGIAIAAVVGMLAVEVVREFLAGQTVLTVGERPSRAICAVLACGSFAVSPARWPIVVCASVLIGLSVIALVQLAAAGRAR